MSLQRLVVISCDGLDGVARDFRDADCERSLEEPFLTVGEALLCLREFGWRVGKPDMYGCRPALWPVRVAAPTGAEAAGLDTTPEK